MNATIDTTDTVTETVPPVKKTAAPRKAAAKKTAATMAPAKKAAAPRKAAAKKAVTATVAATEVPAIPATITVSLLVLGQSEITIELAAGRTAVDDLMVQAALSEKAGEVLVNSQRVQRTHELKDGDKVVFASKIKGG